MSSDLNALNTKFPIDLVSQFYPDVSAFRPQMEGQNFWDAMQNAKSDLFDKCMLLEFALGASVQGQEARKEALAEWWTKNLASWEEAMI
jgi:hypothetical protein